MNSELKENKFCFHNDFNSRELKKSDSLLHSGETVLLNDGVDDILNANTNVHQFIRVSICKILIFNLLQFLSVEIPC